MTAYSDLRALRRKGYAVQRSGDQLEVARETDPPDPERAVAWLRPRKAALFGALDAETSLQATPAYQAAQEVFGIDKSGSGDPERGPYTVTLRDRHNGRVARIVGTRGAKGWDLDLHPFHKDFPDTGGPLHPQIKVTASEAEVFHEVRLQKPRGDDSRVFVRDIYLPDEPKPDRACHLCGVVARVSVELDHHWTCARCMLEGPTA